MRLSFFRTSSKQIWNRGCVWCRATHVWWCFVELSELCCVLLSHCVPPRVDVIITSPYIRCVQTAVAVREVLPSRRGGQASGPRVGRGLAIAFFNQFLDSSGMNCCQSTCGPSSPVSFHWLGIWKYWTQYWTHPVCKYFATGIWFHTFSATEKSARSVRIWQVPILIDSEVSEAGIILNETIWS